MASDRNTSIRSSQILKHTLQLDDLSPDALVWQEPVIDKDLTTPPGSPSEGVRYLVISGGSGTDWAGQDNKITQYINGSWIFYTPQEGWYVKVKDENKFYEYKNSNWSKFEAEDIDVKFLDSSTYNNLQDWINTTQSSGIISGGGITDNENGTVTVASGTGFIKTTDSEITETIFFDWATNNNVSLTNNARNRIYVDYNNGSPIVAASVSEPNHTTQVTVGCVYREGTSLTITEGGQSIYNLAWKVHHHLREAHGIERVSGAIIGETGTRNLTVSSSIIYAGLNRDTIIAFDSSASGDVFSYYYRDGGTGWTKVSDQTQIDNTYYDDGDGTLGELTVNKYGVHWVYMDFGGNIFVVYGQDNYTLANAQITTAPVSLPDRISTCGMLLGRIIIQKGDTSFAEISSAFVTVFSLTLVTSHNDLSNLQGGTGGEYYHLTNSQYTDLHSHANKAELDLISDGDHDVRTDNPHSVDKVDVGLGNVTNDAQLKREAGDINTFPEKTTPHDNDILLIEDSENSYNKKKVKKSNIGGLTSDNVDDFTIKYIDNKLKIADRIELNTMLNAFRIAINGSLSQFNMIDGITDEYEDESGVDTGASTNEDYDGVNDLYKPTVVAGLELDYMEYVSDGAAQAAYVSSEASAEGIEQSYGSSVDASMGIAGDGGTYERCSQGIQSVTDIICTKVSLYLEKINNPTDNMIVTIETDNGGEPSGSLVDANATKTLADSNLPASYEWIDFVFPSSFTLSADTPYHIVIKRDALDSTNKIRFAQDKTSGGYAGGTTHYRLSGAWIEQTDRDHWFRVYGTSIVLQCYSELSIKNQGSYSLKVVAAITDSLNETLTKSGLSIDLTDKDELKLDVRASRTGTDIIQARLYDSVGGWITKNISTTSGSFVEIIWDISGVSNANKGNITKIEFKILNADSETIYYIDNFRVDGEKLNMTLISDSFTAEASPDDARIVLFEEDVDSITLQTDLKAYVSRDGGATYAQVTLTDEGDYGSGKRILTGVVDLTQSGVGSGTNIEYKIETLNNKSLKLHGCGLHWD